MAKAALDVADLLTVADSAASDTFVAAQLIGARRGQDCVTVRESFGLRRLRRCAG
jgi:hypothetical protein